MRLTNPDDQYHFTCILSELQQSNILEKISDQYERIEISFIKDMWVKSIFLK
jgi:hypothetical protein